MKILFVNPPVVNDIGVVLAHTPTLGILYIAGYLEKKGYKDIKIVDADAAKMPWQEFENLFVTEKPDVIGITGTSMSFPAMQKTIEIVRRVLPNSFIIIGGFGCTVEPEKTLRTDNNSADVVVLDEGEYTSLELIQNYEAGSKDFKDVLGIAYLDENNNFIENGRRPYIKDLDELPMPALHLMTPDFSAYTGIHADYKELPKPHGTIMASRGCPYHCTFCSLGSKAFRKRSAKSIVDEMAIYQEQFGVRSIQIYDDEFLGLSPAQNDWVHEICDEVIKRGLHQKLNFLVQGRCSPFIDLELLKHMREAGVRWIWWGVESGSQKILNDIKKAIKRENVIKVISLAKQADIKSMTYMMTGFPGETYADIQQSVDLLKKAKPAEVRFHILSPFPGSATRKYLEDNDLLLTDDYYKYDARTNVIHRTKEMTAAQIKRNHTMLVWRFENGYWYFAKFMLKSLLTVSGWKMLGTRIGKALGYIKGWRMLNYTADKEVAMEAEAAKEVSTTTVAAK